MPLNNVWTPQMDAKLQAWHKQQLLDEQTRPASCVTLTREFGCQAYPVAEALAKRLTARTAGKPWLVVGRQIIDEVAKLSGYTVEQIEKSQDTPASMKAVFSMFLDGSRAEETEIFSYMRDVIRGFAKRGNCILVGRGATYVTQDLDNCVHMRLVAPAAFRIDKFVKSNNMSQAEAREYIDRLQAQRENFVERFVKQSVGDPATYHMILNNACLGPEQISEIIEEYMIRYFDWPR